METAKIDPALIQKNIKSMLGNMTIALEACGIVNPMNKVYYLTKPPESFGLFLHLFTLSALQELRFDTKLSTLRRVVDPKAPNKP